LVAEKGSQTLIKSGFSYAGVNVCLTSVDIYLAVVGVSLIGVGVCLAGVGAYLGDGGDKRLADGGERLGCGWRIVEDCGLDDVFQRCIIGHLNLGRKSKSSHNE
jgi:hypothetical protein